MWKIESCPVEDCPAVNCPVVNCPRADCTVVNCPRADCPVVNCPVSGKLSELRRDSRGVMEYMQISLSVKAGQYLRQPLFQFLCLVWQRRTVIA